MKIHTLNTKEGQAYLYAPDEIGDRCVAEPPRSLADGWKIPTFELVGSDEIHSFRPKGDFLTFTLGTAVLSERAVERLRPILEPCGEILPIRFSNDRDTFYLFNVTRIINAVDMQRSQFMQLPSGALGHCERLVFDPSVIPDDALFFKTTQMGAVYEIYATEAAASAVKNARLTGYEFRLAWSNNRQAENRR